MGNRMSFFDTTPVGRIINRFAKDMAAVDERLGMQFNQVISMFVSMLQTVLVIAAISGPAFLLGAAPVMCLYYWIQKRYKIAALQYKRLDSVGAPPVARTTPRAACPGGGSTALTRVPQVTRSPIYNHCSETLGGLGTIRAYETRRQAEEKNATVTNLNTQVRKMLSWPRSWANSILL